MFARSEDELGEVVVLYNVVETVVDVGFVDDDALVLELRRVERDVFEELFEERMEAAGADVFGLLVDVAGELGDAADGAVFEFQFDAFRCEHGLVLLDERVLRLGEDALEVFFPEAPG